MSFWKNLFSSGKQSTQNEKVYESSDNLGTSYTDYKKVSVIWMAMGMMLDKGNKVTIHTEKGGSIEKESKGLPYICYTFKAEDAARKGLSSLSFIKIASDTKEFISLEVLEFGIYETEKKGQWEVVIWGENLTNEMIKESNNMLLAAGGTKKGERISTKKTQNKPVANKKGGKTTYLRTDKKGPHTYEVHKAPSKEVALGFLKNKTVTKDFYYVIVETTEGTWGKDINGIYQE